MLHWYKSTNTDAETVNGQAWAAELRREWCVQEMGADVNVMTCKPREKPVFAAGGRQLAGGGESAIEALLRLY